jgi:alkylation response protein AidB-like acyl-CoA dehydrogenase
MLAPGADSFGQRRASGDRIQVTPHKFRPHREISEEPMDLTLTDEQAALQQATKDLVDKEIAPFATEWDRAESVDLSIVPKLGALGVLGLTIPEEHGGSGGDHLAYCLALEELGRGDSSVRGIMSVSLGLVTKSIVSYGTPDQIAKWVPRLCAGEILGSFALTESGSGSDPASLKIRATRDGDGWRVSGTKMFITNGTWASVVLLFARTGGEGSRGISAFLVPTDVEGLARNTIHGKLGLRGQATAELVFDNVYLPDEWRLGEEGLLADPRAVRQAHRRPSAGAGDVGRYGSRGRRSPLADLAGGGSDQPARAVRD